MQARSAEISAEIQCRLPACRGLSLSCLRYVSPPKLTWSRSCSLLCHLYLLSNWLGATVLRISCIWILAYARTPRTPGYRPSGSIREIGVRAKGETAWRPVNGAPPSTVRIFPSDARLQVASTGIQRRQPITDELMPCPGRILRKLR